MADTKFSQFTADTDRLVDTSELVGYLASVNFRVTVEDLRKAMTQFLDQLGDKGYILISAEGQSWLKGGGAIDLTTMTQNSNVFSWQSQGTSPETYAWEAVDPTTTLVSHWTDQPFTGLSLGNTGDIVWFWADLLQKATNWPVYIVNTAFSNASVSRYALIGTTGTAAKQHADQIAAATADGSFPGSSGAKPDLRFMALGWGNTPESSDPLDAGVFAEAQLAHKIDTEDANAYGWADESSPLFVMGLPENSQFADSSSSYLGAKLFAEMAGDNVHYVDISGHDEYDDVHQTGDGANYTGRDLFKQSVGLSHPAPVDGKMTYVRATAALSEAYTKAAWSAGAPSLSTGQLNFDSDFSTSPITCTKIRLHYESGDGNNIPWRNLEPYDIIRVADASSPQNYIDVTIKDRAKWDATHPSTPNHAEFTVISISSSSGWPVADSTAVTVSLRKATTGGTQAKNYYTGGAGKVKIPHSLQLSSLDDSTFTEWMPTTYMTIPATRVAHSPLGGGVLTGSPTYYRQFKIQTTNGTTQNWMNLAMPDATHFSFYVVITGFRSDALASSPILSPVYQKIQHGITYSPGGLLQTTALATVSEATTDPTSPHVSAEVSTLVGFWLMRATGQVSQDWEWTYDLWMQEITAA